MHEIIGKHIAGRYRIQSVVGSGGIGTVYRAIQEPLERPVAVKMLRPEFSERQELRRRFVREARAVAALSHPNIAMVHDFGVDQDQQLFMAMEYVEGVSLSDMLDPGTADFHQLAGLFDQILTGLAHAHARGVVHRDIKPGNILVAAQEDGSPLVKIVDFGIAAVAGFNWDDDVHSTGAGQVVGTPQYMAPEQARGERHVTATVDVYAVGLMLYRAVTGVDAFDGDNAMDILVAQVTQPPPPLVPQAGFEMPPGLRELIAEALEKSPLHRLPSATAFRSRLRRIAGHPTNPSLPRALLRNPEARESRNFTLVEEAPTIDASLEKLHGTAVETEGVDPGQGMWSPPIGSALRGESPFVGRETELDRLLESTYAAGKSQRGLVILLEGEAGIGKSRLATALREQLSEHAGFATGHGSFHRDGERGLRGLREALDDLLGTRGLEQTAVRTRLSTRLAQLGITSPADAALISSFLRQGAVTGEAMALPHRPDALFDVVLRLLRAAGAEAPVALFLDDLQWAGREAEAFIEFAATELHHQPARLIIVATLQTGHGEATDNEHLTKRLARFDGGSVIRHAVPALDTDASRRLLETLIQASDALADALVARASGNAMHLVQLVRYLVDERLLEAGPDGWQARPGVDVASVLPPSLADIMALRLDQLEQIAPGGRLRDLLNRCAILGRSFRFSVLERMLRIENRTDLIETVDADIDLLLDEEYLRMRPTRTDDVLAFPSSLVRDTLLERLRNRRTTRRLHANAAEAKLALLGQTPDQIAEDLVRHFAEARDRPRELQYARVAADVAERTHRPHDAASHLARILTILEESGEEDADLLTWTLLRLGRLQIGLGLYADALAHFQRIGGHAAASPRARVMAAYGEAKTRFTLGEFEAARALYASAKATSEALDDPENIARGCLGLARVAFLAGDLDAAQSLASDALEVAEQRNVPTQLPKSIWLLGDIARSRGENASAIDSFERARKLFETVDDQSGIAKCYARMAMVERTLGNYEAAIRHYERAREMYVALGDRKELAHQLNGLGDVARFTGDFTHAASLYRRAVDIFQSMSLPYDAAIALTNLGLVAMEGGRDIEAEGAFRRAAEVAERLGAAYLAIGIGLNLACVLGRLGQENESRTTLDESLALADVSDLVDPDFARPLERMAEILAASGDRDAALAVLARARSMWAELGRPDDGARVAERMEALRSTTPDLVSPLKP